jgi:RHS repeat-associated protein
MEMPNRGYRGENGYRYGFNGKELDDKDGIVQYDYGFRIYDPRLSRFKSLDPLAKSFPMLTPYQFASNSPIANIDLDGGESKYYSIELFETVNGKGKLIHATSRTTEEKTKEAGWFVSGAVYRSPGVYGEGTLYTVTSKKTILKDDGSQEIIIQNVGSIFVPAPPPPSPNRPVSTMPVNVIVWGSGSNPDLSPGSKPNPDAKTITFNYAEFEDIMEPILLGQPDKIPGKLEAPDGHDFIEWIGENGLEAAVDKMKERAKATKDQNTGYCEACQGSFKIDKNGQITWDSSFRAAADTFPSHGEPAKQKPQQKQNEKKKP